MNFSIAVLVTFTFIALPDYATQDDWSGGPGVQGPVFCLGTEFCLDSDVFYSDSSELYLETLSEHSVDSYFWHVGRLSLEDIDGDCDMDILGSSSWANDIVWWRNDDGAGVYWEKITIDDSFDGASSVNSADINGDGNIDVIATAVHCNEVKWWQNTDGSGTQWSEHLIDGDCEWAKSACSADMDGDGDMDVLAVAGMGSEQDDVSWWENIDGGGLSWVKHVVEEQFNNPCSVYPVDIDGDGNMDVTGSSYNGDKISWWRNVDGGGIVWTEFVVSSDVQHPVEVYAADLDSDGDMDILGAVKSDSDIIWWENSDGSGSSWNEHPIDEDFAWASSVYSEDVDGDGDMDVLGAAEIQNDITWWENLNGSGLDWMEHTIDGAFVGAYSVRTADIDMDGEPDVIGAAQASNLISWWDLTGYRPDGSLESSVLDTQCSPEWSTIEWSSEEPEGTVVSFQVRSSNNPEITEMGPWSDTLFTPCSLEGIIQNGKQYLQYRSILGTRNPDVTPTILDVTITWNPVGVHEVSMPLHTGVSLLPVEPNPSSDLVSIRFTTPGNKMIHFRVYDVVGRLFAENSAEEYNEGLHTIQVTELPPGIYFIVMEIGGELTRQRFVIVE